MNYIKLLFLLFSLTLIFEVNSTFAEVSSSFIKFGGTELTRLATDGISAAPQISTNKSGYRTGEIVLIKGNGFYKFEQVTIFAKQIGATREETNLIASWIVFTDKNGNFDSDFVMPFDGKFTVWAIGTDSKQETSPVSITSVTPLVISGNPSCATLNGINAAPFTHITSNFGIKLEGGALTNGTFPFTNTSGRELTGGAPAEAFNTITISSLTSTTFDWTSTKVITAVIVKSGANANVYPYNPGAFIDTLLSSTLPNAISHIEFCFQQSVVLGANVSVGGRITNDNGQGIGKVSVTIQNTNTGEILKMRSSPFGYYKFEELPVGDVYVITVAHKQYVFSPDSQVFTLNEAQDNVDFVGTSP